MLFYSIKSVVFLKQHKETNKRTSNFGERNADDPWLVSLWSQCSGQRRQQRGSKKGGGGAMPRAN